MWRTLARARHAPAPVRQSRATRSNRGCPRPACPQVEYRDGQGEVRSLSRLPETHESRELRSFIRRDHGRLQDARRVVRSGRAPTRTRLRRGGRTERSARQRDRAARGRAAPAHRFAFRPRERRIQHSHTYASHRAHRPREGWPWRRRREIPVRPCRTVSRLIGVSFVARTPTRTPMTMRDFIHGELIDVIEWLETSTDTMVWRFARPNNEIKNGAQLIVRPGQLAVFVEQGTVADVFVPGRHELVTKNLPVLSRLRGWKYGFESPFKAEIVFVSSRQFTGCRWGTKAPIMTTDPELGPVRLRAFGTYSIRVNEAESFVRELVGTNSTFALDQISNQLRDL